MIDEIKKLLFDIKISINSIEEYLAGERDFLKYKSNKMLRRAIEREFEIIGEAINKIEKINSNINISNKDRIIGLRNRVIHGYDKIDNGIIWGTIIRHLPVLKKDINDLLEEQE